MKPSKLRFELVAICLLFFSFDTTTVANKPVYGILTPTPFESPYLQQALQHPTTVHIQGATYTTGTLANKKVVLVVSGLGKVNLAWSKRIESM